MISDGKLVLQTLNGQATAYDQLVDRWSARLFSYVRMRVRNDHVSEDIAQESFLKAYRSLSSLANQEKFGAWLLSIAHRLIIDWSRRQATSEKAHETIRFANSQTIPHPNQTEQSDRIANLKEQLKQLPDELREVLTIFYFDRMGYKEAAKVLDVSVATINSRLTRARALLRKRMSVQEGINELQ